MMSKKTKTELSAENAALRTQLVKFEALLSQRAPQQGALNENTMAERQRAVRQPGGRLGRDAAHGCVGSGLGSVAMLF